MPLIVQEGVGVTVWWKYIGVEDFSLLQFQMTDAAINGQNTPFFPTSHLNSRRPFRKEVGGMTFLPSALTNPGVLVINGHFDPSAFLPDGTVALQLRFRLLTGYKRAARYDMRGFFTDRSITIPAIGGSMSTSRSVQLSGVVRFTQAQKHT